MTYSETVEILVTDHAMWRAAERCRGFDTVLIEDEVREALAAGRVSKKRETFGVSEGSFSKNLYVATKSRDRVYAIRPDAGNPDRIVVVTTLCPLESDAPRNHRRKGVVA